MKYSEQTSLAHPVLSKYTEYFVLIDQILKRDIQPRKDLIKYKPMFEPHRAYDFDSIKNYIQSENYKKSQNITLITPKSVDLVFGISNTKKQAMLLIENKSNAKRVPYNEHQLRQKLKSTKKILGRSIPISKQYICLYNDDKYHQVLYYQTRIYRSGNFSKSIPHVRKTLLEKYF